MESTLVERRSKPVASDGSTYLSEYRDYYSGGMWKNGAIKRVVVFQQYNSMIMKARKFSENRLIVGGTCPVCIWEEPSESLSLQELQKRSPLLDLKVEGTCLGIDVHPELGKVAVNSGRDTALFDLDTGKTLWKHRTDGTMLADTVMWEVCLQDHLQYVCHDSGVSVYDTRSGVEVASVVTMSETRDIKLSDRHVAACVADTLWRCLPRTLSKRRVCCMTLWRVSSRRAATLSTGRVNLIRCVRTSRELQAHVLTVFVVRLFRVGRFDLLTMTNDSTVLQKERNSWYASVLCLLISRSCNCIMPRGYFLLVHVFRSVCVSFFF